MRVLALALAAATLSLAPAAAQQRAKPAKPPAQDWSKTVVAMPEGGFRMGNPGAPVKLIEYGSFTCSHCARFAGSAEPALIGGYVRSGKVAFEYRPFVRDPFDMAAALLARCAGAGGFFAVKGRIFATSQQWIDRMQAIPEDQVKAINALGAAQQMVKLAEAGGLEAIAVQGGLPAARTRQCLTDKAGLDKLVAMRQIALNKHGLEGTPTFIVNGRNTGVYDWAALEPLLAVPPGG